MTDDEFVRLVADAEPSREELLAAGLDDTDVEEIQAMSRCIPRASLPAGAVIHDPLVSLITRYDCSRVEITQVRFAGNPSPHHAGTLVGWWEADR